MNASIVTNHVLILCCYGGSPFVDLQLPNKSAIKHRSTHTLDPTDWIAVDTKGSELNSFLYENNRSKPVVSIPNGLSIDKCDLYNLTFTNVQDEKLFTKYKGTVECRCPPFRTGSLCEIDVHLESKWRINKKFLFALTLIFVLFSLAAVMYAILKGMKCGFCDCFGPFRSPFSKDDLNEPLDENTLNRCLELLQAHEQRTAPKQVGQSRPLISTVNQRYEQCDDNGRSQQQRVCHSHSPPPPYRSVNGSLEDLPRTSQNRQC